MERKLRHRFGGGFNTQEEAPQRIWLLENSNIDEDCNYRVIWSCDADCEKVNESFKIIGEYILTAPQQNNKQGSE